MFDWLDSIWFIDSKKKESIINGLLRTKEDNDDNLAKPAAK